MESYSGLLDPVLLQFIKLLTQSVRSKRRRLFDNQCDTHTKSMCQLFILSTILFCTNSQCSTLQTLLTEATLCYGGTQELIKILNRIGATTSLDTSQRMAIVVETRIIKGIVPELNE